MKAIERDVGQPSRDSYYSASPKPLDAADITTYQMMKGDRVQRPFKEMMDEAAINKTNADAQKT